MDNLPIKSTFGVPQKKDEVSLILSECYSRDLFELEEYEKRIEKVHAVSTIDDLDLIIADIPKEFIQLSKKQHPSADSIRNLSKLTVNHGVQKIMNSKLASNVLELVGIQSVIKLDYRNLKELPLLMTINLDLVGTICRIIVPPDIIVEDETERSGSDIRNKRSRRFDIIPEKHKLILTGTVKRSVLIIKTKKTRKPYLLQ